MKSKLIYLALLVSNILFSQDLSSVKINQYKYIIIDEIDGSHIGEARRYFVKNLQNNGYNVVNFYNPSRTNESEPNDLKLNNKLGIKLIAEIYQGSCFRVDIKLVNSDNEILYRRRGYSCVLLSLAVKDALYYLINYNYKFDETLIVNDNTISTRPEENDDWKGNGSGFFISKNGYIATNYHVIKGAKKIEIEINQNNIKYNLDANVIVYDEENDVAILKLININNISFDIIPYALNKNTLDIGSSVFSLGFPLALTILGTEIKFTDGKISSKSGFMGDENEYQITVPIQPGNSGGPLFDLKGNLIGITSSSINREFDITENVNYAVKSIYLSNLIKYLPIDSTEILLNNEKTKVEIELTELIKILSEFVVLIKVK
jgi:S1-C subfamily serine protease